LGPRPGNLSQNGQKRTPLMMSPTKNLKPTKNFSLQTGRLAESFEGLKNPLTQSIGELWSCKDLANMGKLYLIA